MDPAKRIVASMPIGELWNDSGPISANRMRDLDVDTIRQLLRRGVVRFVVAIGGAPLLWVTEAECFNFWKSEVQTHLAATDRVHLNEFQEGYCYVASEWSVPGESAIVLLEK